MASFFPPLERGTTASSFTYRTLSNVAHPASFLIRPTHINLLLQRRYCWGNPFVVESRKVRGCAENGNYTQCYGLEPPGSIVEIL